MNVQKWIDAGFEWITQYGPKVLGAILIWIIGSWVVSKITKTLRKVMNKREYDPTLQGFLMNMLSWGLKILLILAVLGTIGVETTSFAAILAAAGLAVGLALQGSLSNFAGGVLIMIFKPFKVGQLIEAQGELGVVKEIQIFTTKLSSPSNKEIIIPNGSLSNGNIVNYTSQGTLRIDHTIGVGYDTNIKQAKEVLMKVLTSQEKVLKDPAPTINVSELADSSINFAVRPWANVDDYWDVYFDTLELAKNALDEAGIEIPFPHQVEIQK
ncbi:mechanosensitive ion channel family protein [Ascidiimonas sp. W6]|uniref:mechanosensitive ion channel family protein n=1 Tax=Ascidiimonas meishanensis TaxID=3128903 RepID=UPI0030EDC667